MATLAQLGVSVDPSGATRGLKEVRGQFKRTSDQGRKTGRNIRRSMDSIARSIRIAQSAVAALAAALAIRAGINALNQWAEAADQTAKVAQRLGVAVDRLSELQIAAELSGVAANTFNMALQRMVRRLAEAAQGTGEAKDAIAELGLDAQRLAAMEPDAAMREIAQALSEVKNESDRVRLAFKLFDSEGVALLQMLENGAAGLDEMTEAARRTGGVLTEEGARAAAEYREAVLLLAQTWEGFKQRVIVQILPTLAQWLETITGYFQQILVFSQIDPWAAIQASVLRLTAKVLDLVQALAGLLPFAQLLGLVAGYGADRLRTEALKLEGQLQTEANLRRMAAEHDAANAAARRRESGASAGSIGGSGTLEDPYRTIGEPDASPGGGGAAPSAQSPQAGTQNVHNGDVIMLPVVDEQGNIKEFRGPNEVDEFTRKRLLPAMEAFQRRGKG